MDNPAIDIVIYHNPACGTSRNTLALIRNAGIEPHVVEYLKSPPSRAMLVSLSRRMQLPMRSRQLLCSPPRRCRIVRKPAPSLDPRRLGNCHRRSPMDLADGAIGIP